MPPLNFRSVDCWADAMLATASSSPQATVVYPLRLEKFTLRFLFTLILLLSFFGACSLDSGTLTVCKTHQRTNVTLI